MKLKRRGVVCSLFLVMLFFVGHTVELYAAGPLTERVDKLEKKIDEIRPELAVIKVKSDELEKSLLEKKIDEIRPELAVIKTKSDELEESLKGLRAQIEKVKITTNEAVTEDKLSDEIERLYRFLEIVGVVVTIIFALFGVIGLYVWYKEKNQVDAFQQQITQMDNALQNQQSDMATSLRNNVDTFTNFITTLNNTVESYRLQAETAREQLEKGRQQLVDGLDRVEKEFENLVKAQESQIKELNNTAVELFEACEIHLDNRDKFKGDSQKLNLSSLANNFDALSNMANFDQLVSPISWFLRGLHAFNETKYDDAIKYLTKAKSLAETQLTGNDAAFLPTQLGGKSPEVIRTYLEALEKEIVYHLAIIQYNLGNRDESTKYFEQVIQQNPEDFRSKTFIPELRFFKDAVSETYVNETKENYLNIVNDFLRSGAPPKMVALLKIRQGNIYIHKGILQPPKRENWSGIEDPMTALECFQEAMLNDPDPPFVKCSLALAAYYAEVEEVQVPDQRDNDGNVISFRDEPWQNVFKEVFYEFKGAAVNKNEPLLLVQVYYSAAICCHYAGITEENPSAYFNRVRDHLRSVPKNVKIFSPMTKILRNVEGIQAEMDKLEQQWP